jgi:hypothetical protein
LHQHPGREADARPATDPNVLYLRCILCTGLALLVGALAATNASAEPVDLGNPAPRWIEARFEISPPDRPGQIDTVYTEPFAAWFAPGQEPGEVTVLVDGGVVEKHLLQGEEPRPGSFSDFVWVFDAETGHVRSATVSGTLIRRLRLGLTTCDVDAQVRIRMDTRGRAGFKQRRQLLGQEYHRFCVGDGPSPCTLVEPRPYDPFSGYVNAVGEISAHSGLVQVHGFSPLGEAIFSELEGPLDERQADRLVATPASVHVSSPPPPE